MPELIACTVADLDRLRKLSLRVFTDAFAHLNTEKTMRAYLDTAYHPDKLRAELETKGSHFFFIVDDGEVCGYLKLNEPGVQSDTGDPDSLEVERIYVESRCKGRGLGRTMLEAAESFARKSGLKSIWLGVWEKNSSAIAFYEKMGFYRISEHVFVMGEEHQTDHIMRKDLL